MATDTRYVIVNAYDEPINNDTYTLADAEAKCRQEWAAGWEVFHRPARAGE